jgi:hypothetical protein
MKKLLFYVVLMIFGITGAAGATPMCHPSICPPDSDLKIWYDFNYINEPLTSGISVPYSLNIPSTAYLHFGLIGFIIEGAEVNDKWFLANWTYDAGGNEWRIGHVNAGGLSLKLGLLHNDQLDELRNTGILSGDFTAWWYGNDKLTLKKSFLLAKGCDSNPVPEPATMLLIGSGLVVIAGFGRKKILKKKK